MSEFSLSFFVLFCGKLDLCEGGSFSTAIFNSDIQLSVYSFLLLYICLSVCRFVKGNIIICQTFVQCLVLYLLCVLFFLER